MISIFVRLSFLFFIPYFLFSLTIHWGARTIDQQFDQQTDRSEQIKSRSIAFVVDTLSLVSKDSLLIRSFDMTVFADLSEIDEDSFQIILSKEDSFSYQFTYNSSSPPSELYKIRWFLLDNSWTDIPSNVQKKPVVTASSSFNIMKMIGTMVEQYTQAINSFFNILFLLLVFWPIQKLSLRRSITFRSFLLRSITIATTAMFLAYLSYYLAIHARQDGLINSLLFILTNNFSWMWPVYHLLIFIPFLLIYVAMIWPGSIDRKDRYYIHTRQYWLTLFVIICLSCLPVMIPDTTSWAVPFLGALSSSDQLFSNQVEWIDGLKMFGLNLFVALLVNFLILRIKRSLR